MCVLMGSLYTTRYTTVLPKRKKFLTMNWLMKTIPAMQWRIQRKFSIWFAENWNWKSGTNNRRARTNASKKYSNRLTSRNALKSGRSIWFRTPIVSSTFWTIWKRWPRHENRICCWCRLLVSVFFFVNLFIIPVIDSTTRSFTAAVINEIQGLSKGTPADVMNNQKLDGALKREYEHIEMVGRAARESLKFFKTKPSTVR